MFSRIHSLKFQNKLGIDDYAISWIAFIKGLIIGSLITYYMN